MNSSVRILRVNCSMQIENIVVSLISPRVCREALFQSRAPFSLKSGLVWLFSCFKVDGRTGGCANSHELAYESVAISEGERENYYGARDGHVTCSQHASPTISQ